MPRQNAPLYALNQGEVSKIALARVDVAKMRLAAQCQLNWLPWVLGPMSLRPGQVRVGEVLNDAPTKLLRFVFSKLDTALLEQTAFQMRIWIDDGLVMRVAVATSVGDPLFQGVGAWDTSNSTSGASVTISGGVCTLQCIPVGGLAQIQQTVTVATADHGKEHGIRVVVTNGPVIARVGSTLGASDLVAQTELDTGTHSLACTPSGNICLQVESTDAWNKTLSSISIDNPASGPPQALVLPTPWAASDLSNIRYDQSGDVIFTATYGQQQYKVERRATNGWSTVLYRSSDGPFQQNPGIEANFTPGAFYGNTTLTSDRPWFQSLHVGCLFRLFSNGQFNQAVLGAQNAFTTAVRVTGVGGNRNYTWTSAGTWSGKLTLQRSFDGPNSGFVDVSSVTSNGSPSFTVTTGGSGSTPDLDNIISWERVGFKAGDYTSGSATVASTFSGGGGFAIVRVTGYSSPTQVNIEILQPFSTLQATTDWLEADWSSVIGWPTSLTFHEGRLAFFGRDESWLSGSDDFTSFADIDSQGNSLGDAGAINVAMGYGPVDTIPWGLSLTRLLIGREQSIASARSSNFDQPLTPTDIVIRDCSDQGAERLPAIKVGKRGIMVQQSGRKLYELAFNSSEMDYGDRDLTRLNIDIGVPGFVDIDHATQPDKMICLPKGDGQCAALLYDVADEVEGWWRLQTLGIYENYAVLPSAGIEDAQYFVVNRTINGVQRRFIERVAMRSQCVGGTLNYQADCAMVYSGAAVMTSTIAWLPNTKIIVWADGASIGATTTDASGNFTMPDGLAHANFVAGLGGQVVIGSVLTNLRGGAPPDQEFSGNSATLAVGAVYNGYPCEVWADIGANGRIKHIGPLTVINGVVTLPNNQVATKIFAFLGFVAPFQSAKLAYGAPDGSALNQTKRIDLLGLSLFDASFQGIKYGQNPDALDPLPLMAGGQRTLSGTVWSEYDEPMKTLPGTWDTDARLFLLAQAPNPVMVGGVVVGMQTNEK